MLSPPPEMNWNKNLLKNRKNCSRSVLFHLKTRVCLKCFMHDCRFQIVKQKIKRLLPHVYIDTNEKCEHSSYRNTIKVSVRKFTKLFGQNSWLLSDISNIVKEKKWKSAWLILCKGKYLWYIMYKLHWKKAVESYAKEEYLAIWS